MNTFRSYKYINIEGGLALRDIKLQNLALGTNILWNIISGNLSWRSKVLWKKYFEGNRKTYLEQDLVTKKGSPILSICLKSLPKFKESLHWILGNGKLINIWNDSIMGNPPLVLDQNLENIRS